MSKQGVRLLIAAVCSLATLCAPAAAGETKPVGEFVSKPLWGDWIWVRQKGITKAPAGVGTVHRSAVMALRPEDKPVAVAIDATAADAKAPDVIRFNFHGKPAFDDEHVAPLRGGAGGRDQFLASFGPKVFEVDRPGGAIPVRVTGDYRKYGTYRTIRLEVHTGVVADCAFGDRTYPVYILDGDSDTALGDTLPKRREPGNFYGADTVAVRTDPADPSAFAKTFYGSPVFVDGAWYEVALTDDGRRVEVQPATFKTGKVKVPHERWSAVIADGRRMLLIKGGVEEVSVPAGTWRVEWVAQRGEPRSVDGKTIQAMLDCQASRRGFAGRQITVTPGETEEVSIGGPIQLRVAATVRGRKVTIEPKMTGVSGLAIRNLTNAAGGRPKPGFEIRNAEGERVHSGSFEYG